jgi:hypothetical protein
VDDSGDIHYLHELIEALDRRLPQPERADAEEIARTSAALRFRAIARLTELAREPSRGRDEDVLDRHGHEAEAVQSSWPRTWP